MSGIEKIKQKLIDLKRNPQNNISFIVSIILFVICIYLITKINEVSKERVGLYQKISTLEKDNYDLEKKCSKLEEEKNLITEEYDILKNKYSNHISQINNYVQNRKSLYSSGLSSIHSSIPPRSYIETRIDGEFQGWKGETIFKMRNGTIWQQASYSYKYHYAYSPKVIIYAKSGSAYMKVDGIDDEIRVKRIK